MNDPKAKAANDDTNETPTLGEHVEKANAAADAAAKKEAKAKAKAEKGKAKAEKPKLSTEDELRHENAALRQELEGYRRRREAEQALVSNRDAILHELEACKNRTAAKKSELAETEEKIAALLKQPLPTKWEDTPIGRMTGEAKAPTPPPAMPWKEVLPEVSEDRMRMIGDDTKGELPTVDQLCKAVVDHKAMQGEKRTVRETVTAYGKPWLVTHLWRDEKSGACRANLVELDTKDEYQQLHEAKFGRAVADFDQNPESKIQRQQGGEFCGLTIKVGRRTLVVGPQETALHLAYLPPEKTKGPEEVTLPDAEKKPEAKAKKSKATKSGADE